MHIGAYGWDHDRWQGTFYPDDLPAEWRLTYYGNEFSAVVVPWGRWAGLSAELAASWCEDTEERFRFYLELPAAAWQPSPPDAGPANWRVMAAHLGQRLGGFVAQAPDLDCDRLAVTAAGLAPQAPVAVLGPGGIAVPGCDVCTGAGRCRGPQRLALARCGERSDPRALRALLEGLAANGAADALLWCGDDPLTPQVLAEARIVARLLGLEES